MNKYQAVDVNGSLIGPEVEAEDIRQACWDLGYKDFDIQSDVNAITYDANGEISDSVGLAD